MLVEYLGALGDPVHISTVPITQPSVPYYLLLSFAIDAHPDGRPADGHFFPYWSTTLDPASLARYKAAHPNVRLLASLGGWSLYTTAGKEARLWWYAPRNETAWVEAAVASLAGLARQYHLDGIDVDYESFGRGGAASFARCVGALLTELKARGAITLASVSPFSATAPAYAALLAAVDDHVIDRVNYQFYTDRVPSAAAFVARYRDAGDRLWGFRKLVASFAVRGPGVSGDNFFRAVQELGAWLWAEKGLVGPSIMIWCVEDGAKLGFRYEKRAQDFLHQLQQQHNATTANTTSFFF